MRHHYITYVNPSYYTMCETKGGLLSLFKEATKKDKFFRYAQVFPLGHIGICELFGGC